MACFVVGGRGKSFVLRLQRRPRAMLAIAGGVASVVTPLVASAANLYWDGSGTGWNTATSWSTSSNSGLPDPGAPPGPTDIAIFNITTLNTGTGCNLNANQTASGIIFNSTGNVLIQSGGGTNSLTLGVDGITANPGAGIDSITAPITVAASQTWTNNSTGTMTIGGNVTNNANTTIVGSTAVALTGGVSGNSLIKNGTNLLSINGSTDNTGLGMVINAGTVFAKGSSLAVHAVGGGGLTINGGTAILGGSGNDQIYDFANTAINSGGALDMSGGSETFAGLTLAGSGAAGTGALLNSASSGSTLQLNGTAGLTGNATIGVSQAAGSLTFVGNITTSTFGLTKTGPGTLTLAGNSNNTYTGMTTVADGTLNLNKPFATFAFNGDLTIGDGVGAPASANVVLINQRQFNFGNRPNITINSDGNLNLQTSDDVMRNVTMTAGNMTGLGWYIEGDVTSNAATSSATISASVIYLYNGGTHTFTVADGAAAYDLDVSAPLNGQLYNSPMVKAGPGTLRLSSSNPLVSFTLNAGTVAVGNDGALGNTTPVTVNSGTLQADGSGRTIANPIALNGTLTVAGSQNLTFSGTITGTGGITKNGSGTLVLSGSSANTFTGVTTVNDGTLSLNKNYQTLAIAGDMVIGDGIGAPGSASILFTNSRQLVPVSGNNVTINTDGALNFQSSDDALINVNMTGGSISNSAIWFYIDGGVTTQASSNSATISGTKFYLYGYNGQTHTFTVADGAAAYDLDISIDIDGAYYGSTLLKEGAGTMRLSGNNVFASFVLDAGAVAVANDAALGSTNPVTINGGTLEADGGPHTIANPISLAQDATIAGSNAFTFSGQFTVANSRQLAITNTALTDFAGPVALGNNTLTVNVFHNVTIDGAVSGSGGIVKFGPGTLTFNGSNTFTGTLQINAGEAALSSGQMLNDVLNQSIFTYNAGNFFGRLINAGVVHFNLPNFAAGNGIENDSSLSIPSGLTLTLNGLGLDNEGTLNMTGGTLNLSTAGNAANINRGSLNLSNSTPFFLGSATLSNGGTLFLNGGSVTGVVGQLTNGPGGTITGAGSIVSNFSNAGGLVSITGGTVNISKPFSNSGAISLASFTANLSGGAIANPGSIRGFGNVGNAITNTGVIEPLGGVLYLGGAVTNSASGLIRTGTGTQVVFTTGLSSNAGNISLVGGTFDNNGQPLNNTGQISGYGTLSTGGLTNNGTFTLTGGVSTIDGPVTNASGKSIAIRYNPALFTGALSNNGTIKITNTTVTFAGPYSGNVYISDPSDNFFQSDVTITNGGSMSGGSGDRFYLSGGTFTNNGTFTNAGLLNAADNTFNTGSFTQSGTQAWRNGTTFTNNAGGAATFATDCGSASSSPLNVLINAGSVTFTTTQHLASIALTSSSSTALLTAGGSKVLVAGSVASSGKLDLADNKLITQSPVGSFNGTSYTGVTALLAAGRNGSSVPLWDGVGIVTSQSAATAGNFTTLAIARASDVRPATVTATAVWSGQTITGTDTLVMYTYGGDANLDGKINIDDYVRIDQGIAGGLAGWSNGDFNYDGKVNIDDYTTVIDANIGTQGAPFPTAGGVDNLSVIAVPEPAGLGGLVGLVLIGIPTRRGLARRRRRR